MCGEKEYQCGSCGRKVKINCSEDKPKCCVEKMRGMKDLLPCDKPRVA